MLSSQQAQIIVSIFYQFCDCPPLVSLITIKNNVSGSLYNVVVVLVVL